MKNIQQAESLDTTESWKDPESVLQEGFNNTDIYHGKFGICDLP